MAASNSSILLILMATIAIFGLMVASPCAADNSLTSPNSLPSGHSLNTGSYRLIMQADCNLVVYDSGKPVWATNTGGLARDCRLTMHNNGNLVIYDRSNSVIWQTNTNEKEDHYVLVLQQDRNVVIYGPAVWATGSGPAVGLTLVPHNVTAIVHARAMLNE
uniref:Mannose-specific lectin n=1 Tax=Polygonatum multiflorum TaxID=45371 RepID=O24274_POLML|nr:mannose-specific lectin precursor [Polygonatum multiflorum]